MINFLETIQRWIQKMFGSKLMENNFLKIIKQNKVKFILLLYFLLIMSILIDGNNSSFELLIKGIILFGFLVILEKKEITKIFFVFYFLFFISYFLFFVFYFLVNNEPNAHLANFLFILSNFLFLPMYLLTSIIIFFRNRFIFLQYNLVFFISIFIGFLLPFFGYERGISSMSYTKVDVFLFLLMFLQLLVSLYFYIKSKLQLGS